MCHTTAYTCKGVPNAASVLSCKHRQQYEKGWYSIDAPNHGEEITPSTGAPCINIFGSHGEKKQGRESDSLVVMESTIDNHDAHSASTLLADKTITSSETVPERDPNAVTPSTARDNFCVSSPTVVTETPTRKIVDGENSQRIRLQRYHDMLDCLYSYHDYDGHGYDVDDAGQQDRDDDDEEEGNYEVSTSFLFWTTNTSSNGSFGGNQSHPTIIGIPVGATCL